MSKQLSAEVERIESLDVIALARELSKLSQADAKTVIALDAYLKAAVKRLLYSKRLDHLNTLIASVSNMAIRTSLNRAMYAMAGGTEQDDKGTWIERRALSMITKDKQGLLINPALDDNADEWTRARLVFEALFDTRFDCLILKAPKSNGATDANVMKAVQALEKALAADKCDPAALDRIGAVLLSLSDIYGIAIDNKIITLAERWNKKHGRKQAA